MTDTQQLYKILHLLRLLNSPPAKDVSQLVRRLGSTKSTVYRHIKVLEEVGYEIDTDGRSRKSLKFSVARSGNGVLGPDDIAYLQKMLEQHGKGSAHAKTILGKFHRSLTLIPLADALPQLHASRILQLIRAGIDGENCLMLRRYRSLTSNSVKDRYIEPLEITEDNRYVIGWDKKENGQRQFKLNRIEDVEVLEEKVTPGRFASPMDIFGLTGDDWIRVRLKLSNLAHHLILEEFPLSRPFTRKVGEEVIFDGMVRDWKGIGRFVLGLPGEVEVLEPEGFKEYLRKKIEEF